MTSQQTLIVILIASATLIVILVAVWKKYDVGLKLEKSGFKMGLNLRRPQDPATPASGSPRDTSNIVLVEDAILHDDQIDIAVGNGVSNFRALNRTTADGSKINVRIGNTSDADGER